MIDDRVLSCRAVVFDMDGTILDTLEDMTDSLNFAMEQTGHRHDFRPELVRLFFGSAALVAVERALAAENGASEAMIAELGESIPPEDCGVDMAEAERILAVYKPYYETHCNIKTGPYPGIQKLLTALRGAGVRTAVVSNKPDPAVQALTVQHFDGLFDSALGEQEGMKRKPAPDMTLRALRELRAVPEEAYYIGDTEIDLKTAENAGMRCIAVKWGFRTEVYLRSRGAELFAEDAEDLLRKLGVQR